MSIFTDSSAEASSFVTQFFGSGLANAQARYAVERFRTRSDGAIRRIEPAQLNPGAWRKASTVTASLRTAKAMRPSRNEIVVCTALNGRNSGVAYYGDLASGLFHGQTPRP